VIAEMSGVSRDEKEYDDFVLVQKIKQLVEKQQIAYIDKLLKRVSKPFKGKWVSPSPLMKGCKKKEKKPKEKNAEKLAKEAKYIEAKKNAEEWKKATEEWKKAKRKLILVDMHTKTPWP
tara:strand:- start:35 stop:391 length:357 start_codon:yes stop_codon:yes gene_type:complete